MQLLILKNDEDEFLSEVNHRLVAGWRIVGSVTIGTTSKTVSGWAGFPFHRVYFPVYSAVLDDTNVAKMPIG